MRFFLPFVLCLLLACGSQKITNYEDHSTSISADLGDGGLDSIIHPYKSSMEEQMNEVIGESEITLNKFTPESPLGNFAAEAAYKKGLEIGQNTRALGSKAMEKSFCLLNFGGLRAPINAGAITVGDIYELMPFDNTLVLVKISGEKVRECCEYLHREMGQPVFNASFHLTNDQKTMKIGGEDYNFDEDVVIITSNYLAGGGDKMDFFKDPIMKYDSGIFLRDIFIDEVKALGELPKYKPTGKFHIVQING